MAARASKSVPPQPAAGARSSRAKSKRRPPTLLQIERRLDGLLSMLAPTLATLVGDLPEPKRARAQRVLKLFADWYQQTKSPMQRDDFEAGDYVYQILMLELNRGVEESV